MKHDSCGSCHRVNQTLRVCYRHIQTQGCNNVVCVGGDVVSSAVSSSVGVKMTCTQDRTAGGSIGVEFGLGRIASPAVGISSAANLTQPCKQATDNWRDGKPIYSCHKGFLLVESTLFRMVDHQRMIVSTDHDNHINSETN